MKDKGRTYHREKAKKVRKMLDLMLKNIVEGSQVTDEQREEYERMVRDADEQD